MLTKPRFKKVKPKKSKKRNKSRHLSRYNTYTSSNLTNEVQGLDNIRRNHISKHQVSIKFCYSNHKYFRCIFCSKYHLLTNRYYQKSWECKDCQKERRKRYYLDNKQKTIKLNNKWRKKNIRKYREYQNKYKKGKDFKQYLTKYRKTLKYQTYIKTYWKNRRKNDALYRLKCNLRKRLRKYLKLKNFKKKKSSIKLLGCSLEKFKIYLESKFVSGMSWDNYGEWHIDHIVPLASAKNETELYNLCHFSNLQPLWALDNQKKGAKLTPLTKS